MVINVADVWKRWRVFMITFMITTRGKLINLATIALISMIAVIPLRVIFNEVATRILFAAYSHSVASLLIDENILKFLLLLLTLLHMRRLSHGYPYPMKIAGYYGGIFIINFILSVLFPYSKHYAFVVTILLIINALLFYGAIKRFDRLYFLLFLIGVVTYPDFYAILSAYFGALIIGLRIKTRDLFIIASILSVLYFCGELFSSVVVSPPLSLQLYTNSERHLWFKRADITLYIHEIYRNTHSRQVREQMKILIDEMSTAME